MLVRAGERDGVPQVGAVVTRETSDWSVAPVPSWRGQPVTVRASRGGGALVVRAKVVGGDWQLVRVCPEPAGDQLLVGPYCCAPTRDGLVVTSTSVQATPPDAALHPS